MDALMDVKKSFCWIMTLIIAAVVAVACWAVPAHAMIIAEGTCGYQDGDNLTWALDDQGAMTISGEGAMGYVCASNAGPWSEVKPLVKSVKIGDGVTNVCGDVFRRSPELESVVIGNGVTDIEMYAFSECPKLASVALGNHVAVIEQDAFSYCDSLTSIVLPGSVTTIDVVAFAECPKLASVTFSEGLQTIKWDAFWNCTALTSVAIPKTVTRLDAAAFLGCTALANITVDSNNPSYKTTDGVLFSKDEKTLYLYPAGRGGAYNVPGTVTTIEDYAFDSRPGLTGITIPNSVTKVGDYAFSGCTKLKSVDIPDSVAEIGYAVFEDCTALESVHLPSGVTEIGLHFFSGCTALTSVAIPFFVDTINKYAFSGCTALTHVEGSVAAIKAVRAQAETVTSIGIIYGDYVDQEAFSYCSNLESVTIGGGIKTIQTNAFAYCYDLKSVAITGPLSFIDEGAFAYCPLLESVTIPDSVTELGTWAFAGCESLKSISIPQGVTSLKDYSFTGCEALKSISLPEQLNEIGGEVFSGCAALRSITIPKNVMHISSSAFNDCTALNSISVEQGNREFSTDGRALMSADGSKLVTYANATGSSYTIPKTVTTIGEKAFEGCSSLKSINIPDTVTEIEICAFEHCASLGTVTIPDSIDALAPGIFHGCTSLVHVDIPDSVKSIGGFAFWNCTSLTAIDIPDSVTLIGNSAFSDCTALQSLTIPASVTFVDVEAFWDCTSLKDVTILGPIDRIAGAVFSGCSALASITIPSSVTSVGYYAFSDCSALREIHFGGSPEDWQRVFIDDGNEALLNAAIEYGKQLEPGSFPISLDTCAVTLSANTYTYNGQARTPQVTVTNAAGEPLVQDVDYAVSYPDNSKNAGTHTVTVEGVGAYTGTVTKTFTINPQEIMASHVTLSTTVYTYNGQAKKPVVDVTSRTGINIKHGYASNAAVDIVYSPGRTSVGTYTVTVTGKGNWTGKVTKTFWVNPAKANMKSIATYGKGTLKWTATAKPTTKGGAYYQVQYRKQGTSTYKYSTSSKTYYGKVGGGKLTKGKRYYVRVRAVYKTSSGSTYYGAWSTAKLSPIVK